MNHAAIINILVGAGIQPADVNSILAGLTSGHNQQQVETLLQQNGVLAPVAPALAAQIMPHLAPPVGPGGPTTVVVPANLQITPPSGTVNWNGTTAPPRPATPTPPATNNQNSWLHTGIIAGLVVLAAIILGLVLNAGHVTMFEEDRADHQTTREFVENEHNGTRTKLKNVVKAEAKATRKAVDDEGNATRAQVEAKGNEVIAASDANTALVIHDNKRTRAAVFAARKQQASDLDGLKNAVRDEGNATTAQVKKPRRLRFNLGKALSLPGSGDE